MSRQNLQQCFYFKTTKSELILICLLIDRDQTLCDGSCHHLYIRGGASYVEIVSIIA